VNPAHRTAIDFELWVDAQVAKATPWTTDQRAFVMRCFPGEWSTFVWGRSLLVFRAPLPRARRGGRG
jgi:hypothetical protein